MVVILSNRGGRGQRGVEGRIESEDSKKGLLWQELLKELFKGVVDAVTVVTR